MRGEGVRGEDMRGCTRCAPTDPLHSYLVRQCGSKLLIHPSLHQHPIGGNARLTSIAKLGRKKCFHGHIDVAIVEDNEGSVATKFHGDLFDSGGGFTQEPFSDGC